VERDGLKRGLSWVREDSDSLERGYSWVKVQIDLVRAWIELGQSEDRFGLDREYSWIIGWMELG
jgi:hypothetical protein